MSLHVAGRSALQGGNTDKQECKSLTSPTPQQVKNLPDMQEIPETPVQPLGREDNPKKEMATQSSILA